MKKLLTLVAALLLFLSGCGNTEDMDATLPTTVPTTAATEPTGIYQPDSDLEKQTEGAIRAYDLQGRQYSWVNQTGGNIVLGSVSEITELMMLSGDDGIVAATAQLSFPAELTTAGNQPIYGGYAFFDSVCNQVVFLDGQLSETERVDMPEEMQGAPVCSPDGQQLYYCVGEEIRCLDVARGISRLVKSHGCVRQTLLGTYMEGKIVASLVTYAENEEAVVFLSSENGQTLATQNREAQLYTYQDAYLLLRKDGIIPQTIFGSDSAAAQLLFLQDEVLFPALELQAALGCTKIENGLAISLYSLLDGTRWSALELPGVTGVKSVSADSVHTTLWLLISTASGEDMLLQWDISKSEVDEEGDYAGVLYTADNPDKDSLRVVQKRADTMSRDHGVTIRLLEDATKRNNGIRMTVEYQPEAINYALDELERAFGMFPDDFLYKSVATKIRICIVRSIDGAENYAKFWYDGDAFIILPVDGDIEESFLQAVSYVVESHILGNSPMVDTWSGMNPDGFAYGDPSTYSDRYLQGDAQAFPDADSMTSVTEDRSRIFFQAMQPDNAQMFSSETMQRKLLQLCRGIRDAWNLERKTDVYQWEQYLAESIAYKE